MKGHTAYDMYDNSPTFTKTPGGKDYTDAFAREMCGSGFVAVGSCTCSADIPLLFAFCRYLIPQHIYDLTFHPHNN